MNHTVKEFNIAHSCDTSY